MDRMIIFMPKPLYLWGKVLPTLTENEAGWAPVPICVF
jgi:hypothetical protein